jgi:hypothetical protein
MAAILFFAGIAVNTFVLYQIFGWLAPMAVLGTLFMLMGIVRAAYEERLEQERRAKHEEPAAKLGALLDALRYDNSASSRPDRQ